MSRALEEVMLRAMLNVPDVSPRKATDAAMAVLELWATERTDFQGDCPSCGAPLGCADPDPCLDWLPGVTAGCCGHGDPERAYLLFENGVAIRGFHQVERVISDFSTSTPDRANWGSGEDTMNARRTREKRLEKSRHAVEVEAERARQQRTRELEALFVALHRPVEPTSWNGLHPEAFAHELSKDVRGGLPGASLGSGSPSASKPTPHLDQTDLSAERTFTVYVSLLEDARRAALAGNMRAAREHVAKATSLESGVLPRLHMSTKELRDYLQRASLKAAGLVGAVPCKNPNCQRPVRGTKTDRLIDERCSACYEFRADHEGKERPKRLCMKDDERLRRTA